MEIPMERHKRILRQKSTVSSLNINLQRMVTGKKVDRVARKTMPSMKTAERIAHLLEEAAAFVDRGREDIGLWHGQPASPHALQKAKKLLARYGRDIEDWRGVAEYHGLSWFSSGYFDEDF